MTELMGFLKNPIFHAGFFAWMTAQLIKILIELVIDKRLNFKKIMASGGMPSSHSALVTALSTSVGMTQGFGSPLFVVCAAFSFIVMYDASGVRRAAGEQAQALNQLLEEHQKFNDKETEQLREILGHSPLEVAAGAVLGVVIAVLVTPW